MAIDPKTIPAAMLRCMPKETRKPLGNAGLTPEEVDAKIAVKLEKQLHEQCLALLMIRGVFCVHSRMDRKATTPVGTPDLCFAVDGIPCAVELKRPGEHPTPDQVKVMQQMMDNGWRVRVITSLEGFKSFLDNSQK
jgi:hypothetical protein